MWPRIALWVAGFLAIPAAKYVWGKILETPSYWKDMEKVNAKRAAEEQENKELLDKFKKSIGKTLSPKERQEILFRDFRGCKK